MRKGQIQQVFVYIMAILVIGFLILFGYRMIDNIIHRKCSVEDTRFVQSLQNQIERNTRYDTVTKVSISTPCKYTKICLINADTIGDVNFAYPENPIIEASVQDGIPYNVYLIHPGETTGETVPALYDERITVNIPNHPLDPIRIFCVDANQGHFDFWLRGLGQQGVLAYIGNNL